MTTKLTKMDIATYYEDAAVRKELLRQLQGKKVMSLQNLRSGDTIVRRYASKDIPITISKANNNPTDRNDLSWYTSRRFSEFHPVQGMETTDVWVDIDPGKKVKHDTVKMYVPQVQTTLQSMPQVSRTDIVYSGGKGYHVRGTLKHKTNTDKIRKLINKQLDKRFKTIKGITRNLPKDTEIRFDTSTLRDQGSLRAAYSLNSDTGRVAVPLTERELRGFKPSQADVRRILRKKEFAPGIPRNRRMYALPAESKDKIWTLAIQDHRAKRAGKHWDLRLVDPETGYAHSWAIPKSRLPDVSEKPLLAVRTPTHTANYALNFGAEGPRYIAKKHGKGTVELKHKEPVKIRHINENSVVFKRIIAPAKGETYTLFKTKGDPWLLRRSREQTKESSAMSLYSDGYRDALVKLGFDQDKNKIRDKANEHNDLKVSDEHTTVGKLITRIQNLDSSEKNLIGTTPESNLDNPITARLNRPTDWGAPTEIPTNYMQGASKPIPGGGI